jgi:hypothetical protein
MRTKLPFRQHKYFKSLQENGPATSGGGEEASPNNNGFREDGPLRVRYQENSGRSEP